MKVSFINLALLVASVAANAAPDVSPVEIEVRGLGPHDASGLHSRSDIHKRNGMLYCGIMASTFMISRCVSLLAPQKCTNRRVDGDGMNLRSLYDDFGGETYTAPAHGCIRAKCWNTSGVYVCNVKNDDPNTRIPIVQIGSVLIHPSLCRTRASH